MKRDLDYEVVELMQTIGLLVRKVRAAASSDELSLSEAAVLKRLEREGPATAAELARAESVRPQSMGSTIAALEERGLVRKKPHPTDGRQMNVELTQKGRALRDSSVSAKRKWLMQAVSSLDQKELDTLFAAGRIIKKMVQSS